MCPSDLASQISERISMHHEGFEMVDMRDELLVLECQLEQAEKTLPFVPPGEYERTRAQLQEIKETIRFLKNCPEQQRIQ